MFLPEIHRAFSCFVFKDSGKIEIRLEAEVDSDFLKTFVG